MMKSIAKFLGLSLLAVATGLIALSVRPAFGQEPAEGAYLFPKRELGPSVPEIPFVAGGHADSHLLVPYFAEAIPNVGGAANRVAGYAVDADGRGGWRIAIGAGQPYYGEGKISAFQR